MDANSPVIQALKRLDPTTSPQEGAYVERTVLGGGWTWDIETRIRSLLAAGSRFRILLTGAVGVGKSTEVRRLAARLSGSAKVFHIDGAATARQSPQRALELITDVVDAYFPVKQAANTVPQVLGGSTGPPAMLLIDGLERVADPAAWFGAGTPLVESWLPAVLYVAPHSLMAAPSTARDERFGLLYSLPPFPVLLPSGNPNPSVVDHLAAGLERRLDGLSVLSDPSLLRRIALASGGVPRDAILILRTALLATGPTGKVSVPHVIEGERELRQDLEQGLLDGDDAALRSVTQGASYRADPRLLVNRAVLAYEGPDGRYFHPHPMLMGLIRGRDRGFNELANALAQR